MTRKSWPFFLSFCAYWEVNFVFDTLPSATVWCGACKPGRWRTGSEEERQHGGSSKNHQIWIQRLFHAWAILAAVSVKARVCIRSSIFSAHKAIILNVGTHYVHSQPNTTPYWHTFGATHSVFRARPRWTCFSLRCCVCVSPTVSHRALPRLKGEGGAICVKTSPPKCRMSFTEVKHTFQDRKDMSCDFQPPFIGGEGGQYLRVIFSAVRMCSMVQFQRWC